MKPSQVLTALFLRGAQKPFEQSINRALKKKQKKSQVSQGELIHQYNVYNFVEAQPRPKCQYFIAYEQLKGFDEAKIKEQKEREKKDIVKVEEDIKNFRLLQEKIIKKKDKTFQIQHPNLKTKIVRQQMIKWFPNTEIDTQLRTCQDNIQKLKKQMFEKETNLQQGLKIKMQLLKARFDSYDQGRQIYESLRKNVKIQAPNSSFDKLKVDNRIQMSISLKIQDFFIKVIQAVHFESLLNKRSLFKKWKPIALLIQENQIIAKKIKGKMLYDIEEAINKKKSALHQFHISKEYYIRQKMFSLHRSRGLTMKNHTLQFNENPSNYISNNFKTRNREIGLKKPNQREKKGSFAQQYYEKPKSKSQILENINEYRVSTTTQPVRLTKIDTSNVLEIRKLMDRTSANQNQRIQRNKQQNSKYIQRFKKPSPLSLQNLRSFTFQNQQSQLSRIYQSKKRPIKDVGSVRIQKLLKYPIKIGPLQVYSSDSSSLCYHIDDIVLKELSLKFIQDRLKMKENRVKIEYPQKYSEEDEIKVMKSMQILNCLGAEVSCQPESNYKYWNQIDEIDILAASWLLQFPLREIINMYVQYFGKVDTKK